MRCAIAAVLVCLASLAGAHDGHHDEWFKSLTNELGVPCCDGSDALRVEDPDWAIKDGHYRVFLDGKWMDVPDDRVVQAPNIVGPAFVWPGVSAGDDEGGGGGEPYIRCFLPGAGA